MEYAVSPTAASERVFDMTADNISFRVAVLTVSDRAYSGERKDESGPAIRRILEKAGYIVEAVTVVADEAEQIEKALVGFTDTEKVDLVLTTGGTGFSVRDITPEVTMKLAHRNVPGISEAIRAFSLTKTKHAMLSRGVSVIRNSTLIINLPGSPRSCEESLEAIMDALPHGLGILKGLKLDK